MSHHHDANRSHDLSLPVVSSHHDSFNNYDKMNIIKSRGYYLFPQRGRYHSSRVSQSSLSHLRALPNNNNSGDSDDNSTTSNSNNTDDSSLHNREEEETMTTSSLSEEIQEKLITSLQFEIGAKRNLDDHVKESGEKLKALAEEAKEEMDKAAELAKLRGDLAFDSALADINREADKFERKLRQRREAMEQEREEMQAWVRDVGQGRNEGQFFGNLYDEYDDDDKKKKTTTTGGGEGGFVDPEREEMMERRKRVIEPAEKEIKSPARMYIFMVLSGMLLVNVVSDVVLALDREGQSPSWGLDGLYCVLASIALWIVVSERRELIKNE